MSTTPLRRTQGGIPRFLPEAAAPAHILTQSQAEAVYSAMCALKKVGAMIRASVPVDDATWVHIEECADTGQITLTQRLRTVARHSDQAAFAAAYGLQLG